jgi:hypothetical protein
MLGVGGQTINLLIAPLLNSTAPTTKPHLICPSLLVQVSVCCWLNIIYNVFTIECVPALEKLLKEHTGRYATGDEVSMVRCYSN